MIIALIERSAEPVGYALFHPPLVPFFLRHL